MQTDLGPLAPVAANADEWKSRSTAGGMTWAGLWRTQYRDEVLKLIEQHTTPLTQDDIRQLVNMGQLPGVRSFTHLVALLPTAQPEQRCDDSTTIENADAAEDEPPLLGIPIFDHGTLDQARLSEVRHAVHLMRYLDDYHEPTLAALKRRLVRAAGDGDQYAAAQQAADRFLERPTRWRDVVSLAVYLSTVRNLEMVLQTRIKGKRGTIADLQELITAGVGALIMSNAVGVANEITKLHDERLARLKAAKVVLMYEEHRYLHLLGINDGRSTRRHLPRGLHLIFSDQTHRRGDRTAGLWLDASNELEQVAPYYFAKEMPQAYAAKKRRDSFRLVDEAAVHQYVIGDKL